MTKRVIIVAAALLVAGCAAPKLPLLSEVELAEDSGQSSLALPSGDDPAPESLQGELAGAEVALSAEDQAILEAQSKNARGGLFGLFRRQSAPAETVVEVAPITEQDAIVDVGEVAELTTVVGVPTTEETQMPQAEELQDAAQEAAVVQADTRPRRNGLFGLFGGRDSKPDVTPTAEPEAVAPSAPEAAVELTAEAEEEVVVVASLAPEVPRRPRRGLFGRQGPKASRSNAVTPDEALVFGQVGSACGVRGRALGKQVDQFEQSGTDFKLYDSAPGSLEPRLHYITGFSDGCPRKFIAALALLGSAQLHETMRYDAMNRGLSYSETDVAYEGIKQRVCRAGRDKPCPENRVAKMEASTAFITYYRRFGDTRSWAEILLHKGKVAASSTRAR